MPDRFVWIAMTPELEEFLREHLGPRMEALPAHTVAMWHPGFDIGPISLDTTPHEGDALKNRRCKKCGGQKMIAAKIHAVLRAFCKLCGSTAPL